MTSAQLRRETKREIGRRYMLRTYQYVAIDLGASAERYADVPPMCITRDDVDRVNR